MRIAFSTFGFTGEKYETAGRRLTLTNRPTLHQENLLVELPGFLTKVVQKAWIRSRKRPLSPA
jgi:hypothetical protein